MKAPIDLKPGTFYDVGQGYVLPLIDIPFKTELALQTKLPITCMFEVHLIEVGGQRAGFFFASSFAVRNEGGYLLTFLQNKGPAKDVETLIKNEDLVLYNFPNRGSLAVSPKVNPLVETIFEEQ